MKFQHYSNTTDTYAYLILEPVTPIDKHRILFEEASARQNISSTDNLSTILGKIKKYFSDLKTVAFTGKYTDLVDTPSIKITDNGNDTHIYLGESERVLGLENQLAAVNFKNEGGGPNQGMRFITRQPNSGDIIFGNITGDTDLTFPFSFGVDANGYGYKKHKSNNITHFGDIYAKNVLNTTEQISANTATGYVAGALAAKAMIADYNAKINQVNSNLANAMNTNDLLLNYMDKTSTWIQIDTLNNIDNYKFIFFASMAGNSIVHCCTIPKLVFYTFHGVTNFIQLGDSNVYFISNTKIGILSTSDTFRIYGIV